MLVILQLQTTCQKSPQSPSIDNNLLGVWHFDRLENKGVNNSLSTCRKKRTFQFNAAGTFTRLDYFDSASTCVLDENSNGTFNYDTSQNKITINFNDPSEGAMKEVKNNVQLTGTTLTFTWDENRDGVDEWKEYYIK